MVKIPRGTHLCIDSAHLATGGCTTCLVNDGCVDPKKPFAGYIKRLIAHRDRYEKLVNTSQCAGDCTSNGGVAIGLNQALLIFLSGDY